MKVTASEIQVMDLIELITPVRDPSRNHREQQFRQGQKFPVAYIPVTDIESYRGNRRQRTFTFPDGRTLTVSANSKVVVK